MSPLESTCRYPKIPIKVIALSNRDRGQIGDGVGSLDLTCGSEKVVENFAQIDCVCETLTLGSSHRILDYRGARLIAKIGNHR